VKNVALAARLYPGWEVWFYVGEGTDPATVDKLRERGVHLEFKTGLLETSGSLWRFEACLSDDVDVVIFRDADSLLSEREANLVDDWLRSGFPLHVFRDYPAHTSLVMAGLWGCTSLVFPDIRKMLCQGISDFRYGCDEILISQHLYPAYLKSIWIHSPYLRYPLENIQSINQPPAFGFMGEIDAKNLPITKRCPPYPKLQPYPAVLLGCVLQDITQKRLILDKKEAVCLLYAIYSILSGNAKRHYEEQPFVPTARDEAAYTEFCRYLLDQEWADRRCKRISSALVGQTLMSWKEMPAITRWLWSLTYSRHRRYWEKPRKYYLWPLLQLVTLPYVSCFRAAKRYKIRARLESFLSE
jgi:hypothetical protein